MEKTNHVFIVGEGAQKFAEDEGFAPMNLLTERSRIAWLAWKASSSPNWRPGLDSPEWKEKLALLLDTPEKQAWRAHIEASSAVSDHRHDQLSRGEREGRSLRHDHDFRPLVENRGPRGRFAAYRRGTFCGRRSGRRPDPPGAAKRTSKFPAATRSWRRCAAAVHPTDACMEALHRVQRNYKAFPERLKLFHIQFYAVNKNGEYGAVSLWEKHIDGRPVQYAVHDGTQAKLLPTTALFERDWRRLLEQRRASRNVRRRCIARGEPHAAQTDSLFSALRAPSLLHQIRCED